MPDAAQRSEPTTPGSDRRSFFTLSEHSSSSFAAAPQSIMDYIIDLAKWPTVLREDPELLRSIVAVDNDRSISKSVELKLPGNFDLGLKALNKYRTRP
jgi:hypothetical protein